MRVSRWLAITGGILVLAVMAAGLTEAALALGRLPGAPEDVLTRLHLARISPMPTIQVVASSSPTPVPLAQSTPAPSPSPAATATLSTATTNAFVHLRAANSTTAAILADLNGGTVVELLPQSDSSWQQVRYNGQVGFVYRSYLSY